MKCDCNSNFPFLKFCQLNDIIPWGEKYYEGSSW